jgi:hypothetical protein
LPLSITSAYFAREPTAAASHPNVAEEVLALDEATIDRTAAVATRYQLSHWDALIVASALLVAVTPSTARTYTTAKSLMSN